MLEQISNVLVAMAFFQDTSGVGIAGLTVTVDVDRIANSAGTPAITSLVTAASAVDLGKGYYGYVISAANNSVEGEYLALFKTASSSVVTKQLPSLWSSGVSGVERLDEQISLVDNNVWAAALPGAYSAGQAGKIVGDNLDLPISQVDLDVVDNIWGAALPGAFGAGSAGNILGTNLDIKVSEVDLDVVNDILGAPVPNGYAAGTLGYVIGTNLDAPVSGGIGGDDITVIADGMSYRPYGAIESVTLGAGIETIIASGLATAIFVQAIGNDIYFTNDESNPTATHGLLIAGGEMGRFYALKDTTHDILKFLRSGDPSTLVYQYYKPR